MYSLKQALVLELGGDPNNAHLVSDDAILMAIRRAVETESTAGATKERIAKLEAERDALEEKLAESDHALIQLGRLKAQWQAEALREALRRMKGTCFGENRVEEYAEELRRQAEEAEQ